MGSSHRPALRTISGCLLGLLLVGLSMGASACGPKASGEVEGPGAVPPSAPLPPTPAAEEPRALYLRTAREQLRRLERAIGPLGPVRHALAGLLVAATAKPEDHVEVGRQVGAALAACTGRTSFDCARAHLVLQRLVLQLPEALGEEQRREVRRAISSPAPPPSPAQIENPWDFQETENQRAVGLARSLVAHRLAGTVESPSGQAWVAYARAFLESHQRLGWYEASSPGYLGLSVAALLHLADFAPDKQVRALAVRQLHVLFAGWAQSQVGGFPAGAKSRTYVHWALSPKNTPWQAWAWYLLGAAGEGDPSRDLNLMDWPELALSTSYRVPEGVRRLLRERRRQEPYEIWERRVVPLSRRMSLDASLYTYATQDYILGVAQALDGRRLGVSGGQEIMVTLYPEGAGFAPLYLWSRRDSGRGPKRWRSFAAQDLAVGVRDRVLARLGEGGGLGHAYLAAAWSRPEVVGDRAFSRCGETYVALVTPGGWELTAATERLPELYRDPKSERGAWVLVARVQPASVGLEVARRVEDGPFETWKQSRVTSEVSLGDGAITWGTLSFVPGKAATLGDEALEPSGPAVVSGPFLRSLKDGAWSFHFGRAAYRLEPLSVPPPVASSPKP